MAGGCAGLETEHYQLALQNTCIVNSLTAQRQNNSTEIETYLTGLADNLLWVSLPA